MQTDTDIYTPKAKSCVVLQKELEFKVDKNKSVFRLKLGKQVLYSVFESANPTYLGPFV